MQIAIDVDSSEPLFSQLIAQVKRAVEKGHKQPGDALPSIRQLANDLELNSNTVAKAYRLLERDSIIETRGYRGTFIHPDAPSNCTVDLNLLIEEKIAAAIADLKEVGATDSEIRVAFGKVMQQ
ncbi:MAG: GntR family transcriptional regulator [Pseudomonadota bacterium]